MESPLCQNYARPFTVIYDLYNNTLRQILLELFNWYTKWCFKTTYFAQHHTDEKPSLSDADVHYLLSGQIQLQFITSPPQVAIFTFCLLLRANDFWLYWTIISSLWECFHMVITVVNYCRIVFDLCLYSMNKEHCPFFSFQILLLSLRSKLFQCHVYKKEFQFWKILEDALQMTSEEKMSILGFLFPKRVLFFF